ncbi:MAG TPA: hypothetical protein VGX78_18440, partial [Pirellulales bacterium]|nr:hypothetical protein [Pirellulales bacterium]
MPTILRNSCRRPLAALFCLVCACSAPSGLADEIQAEQMPAAVSPAKSAETITTDAVQRQLEQVKTAKDLDDATAAKSVELLQQALAELERAAASAAKSAEVVKVSQQAPELSKRIRAELEAPQATQAIDVPSEATLPQLETLLAQAQAELTAAQEELTRLDSEPKRRADRRLEIPKQLDQAANNIEEVHKQLAAPPAADEPKPLADARRALLLARQ